MAMTLSPSVIGDADGTVYPESDGKPLADNTLQDEWIAVIKSGYQALYANEPDVFAGGNLLWYPMQGKPEISAAPDIFLAFGRPKGHRSSYKQWLEDGTPMQVVWEILSPSNRPGEMAAKALFYDAYGAEEYYLYDPAKREFDVLLRSRLTGRLDPVARPAEVVSPRTGTRFELIDELVVYRPDGERFKPFEQVMEERNAAERRADAVQAANDRLAARLRELGIDPDTV